MTDRFLAGRVAWVTDGLSATGQATALALAAAGADIAFGSGPDPGVGAAHPDEPRSRPAIPDRLAELIRERGVGCLASSLDLRANADVERFHARIVETFGPVAILINSAPRSAREDMIGHRSELWDSVLDINLNGPYRTIKRCMASMVDAGYGRIVNVASTAAKTGYAGHSAYCASMAALLGLTRCVALEGAEHGVTCNTILPGWIDNVGSCAQLPSPADAADPGGELDAQEIPQKRLIRAAEVAEFIVFLCRPEAWGLTGEAITVAGGSTSLGTADGSIR